jgi:peptidoglycan hydrolase CwlO-like protein
MERNSWIRANTALLLNIKQKLIECEYLPEYDDFPLREIQKLLNGAEAEIMRLNSEIHSLKEERKTNVEEIKRLDELVTRNQ